MKRAILISCFLFFSEHASSTSYLLDLSSFAPVLEHRKHKWQLSGKNIIDYQNRNQTFILSPSSYPFTTIQENSFITGFINKAIAVDQSSEGCSTAKVIEINHENSLFLSLALNMKEFERFPRTMIFFCYQMETERTQACLNAMKDSISHDEGDISKIEEILKTEFWKQKSVKVPKKWNIWFEEEHKVDFDHYCKDGLVLTKRHNACQIDTYSWEKTVDKFIDKYFGYLFLGALIFASPRLLICSPSRF